VEWRANVNLNFAEYESSQKKSSNYRFPSLVVVVVVVLLGRSRLIAVVVVDDLLDAPRLLLRFFSSMVRAGVGRLVVLRLVDEGFLLFVIDHDSLPLRIHLFGRLVPL
jgi:hypothetical protein